MAVEYATTDLERLQIRDFLAEHLPDIAETAVPVTAMDAAYAPLVPVIRGEDDEILAAALTCRAQVAAGAAMVPRLATAFGRALDRHSELDLLAVAVHARGQGLGTELVNDMEGHLIQRGVKVWFGNVVGDGHVDRLREFYSRLGFTVLDDGQPLPPFFGRNWIPPGVEMPAFFFYKTLPKP